MAMKSNGNNFCDIVDRPGIFPDHAMPPGQLNENQILVKLLRSGKRKRQVRGSPHWYSGKNIKRFTANRVPMIEQKASRGNIHWFRLYGKLTEEDYTANLIPELERAIEQYKKIRLLLQVEYFGGWTEGGALQELKEWPQFSKKIERIAIVADDSWDDWMTWMAKIAGMVTGTPVRFFRAGRIEEAWDWLEAM